MSTWPVFWRTAMSTHSFSSCSGTSSCVSTTIALRWSRIARAWRSSDQSARGAAAITRRTSGTSSAFFMAREATIRPSRDLSLGRSLEARQLSAADRLADPLHPVQVEKDVVDREKHRGGEVAEHEEVPQVGS